MEHAADFLAMLVDHAVHAHYLPGHGVDVALDQVPLQVQQTDILLGQVLQPSNGGKQELVGAGNAAGSCCRAC